MGSKTQLIKFLSDVMEISRVRVCVQIFSLPSPFFSNTSDLWKRTKVPIKSMLGSLQYIFSFSLVNELS